MSLCTIDVGGPEGVDVLDGVFRDFFGSLDGEICGVRWDWCPDYLRDLDGCENWRWGPAQHAMHEGDEYASDAGDAGDAWSEADDDSSENSCSSSEVEGPRARHPDCRAVVLD